MILTKKFKIKVKGESKTNCLQALEMMKSFSDVEMVELCECKTPLPFHQEENRCAVCDKDIR